MVKFSSNEAVNFFRMMDLPENKFMVGDQVVDIFTLLGFEPEFYSDGTRKLTPYEILGIPPQFYPDGRERPIVFYIKNKCRKLGKYEGENKEFVHISRNNDKEKTTLEELKIRFKHAVYDGRDYDAEEILKIIDQMTDGNAEEFLSTFFNCRKKYKKLKKQLILDLFAHFFLMYCSRRRFVKTGIVRSTKIFKPYRESVERYVERGDEEEMSAIDYGANVNNSNDLETVTFQQNFGVAEEHEEPQVSANTANFEESANSMTFGEAEENKVPIEQIAAEQSKNIQSEPSGLVDALLKNGADDAPQNSENEQENNRQREDVGSEFLNEPTSAKFANEFDYDDGLNFINGIGRRVKPARSRDDEHLEDENERAYGEENGNIEISEGDESSEELNRNIKRKNKKELESNEPSFNFEG